MVLNLRCIHDFSRLAGLALGCFRVCYNFHHDVDAHHIVNTMVTFNQKSGSEIHVIFTMLMTPAALHSDDLSHSTSDLNKHTAQYHGTSNDPEVLRHCDIPKT